jgi:hypothetical protein
MIPYNSPVRMKLVNELIIAINNRIESAANLPFSVFQYWKATRIFRVAHANLMKHDHEYLRQQMQDAADAYFKLPLENRIGSAESDTFRYATKEFLEHKGT